MSETETLQDLRARLVAADEKLMAKLDTYWEGIERSRISGKAEGVRLAISYLDEALR